MVDIKKVVGVVQDVGDSIEVNLLTVYTFMELADGQILQYVAVPPQLRGKMTNAIKKGERLELHLGDNPKGKDFKMTLLALSAEDGRVYSLNTGNVASKILLMSIVFFVLGCLTIFFLVGFAFWWLSWKAFSGWRTARKTEEYVKSIPGVIYL